MSMDKLKEAYGEIADLVKAAAVLGWDQQTYMPPRGFAARGQQLATLSGIIHERMTADSMGRLIAEAKAGKLSEDDRHFLHELEFQRDRSAKLPAALVKALALQESRSFDAWQRAKAAKNFSIFAPELKEMVRLLREKAACFGYEGTPWDALAQDYERGTSAELVRAFFEPLRVATVDLLKRIEAAKQVDASFLEQKWDVNIQREFAMRVLRDLGYDMARGRVDLAPHPFCTSFGPGDVRITTRFSAENLFDGLSSVIHEMGHALYDMGFREEDHRTPLAEAPSLGIHESQSRFWEIRIAQSRPFWQHFLPILKQYFPGRLDGVDAEQFYRAVNVVEPGFIRVESDEVSYNLHIIIRFELEVKILSGELEVDDIPEAWNRAYKENLGLTVPNDAVGCLQDVHWAYGSFGYFPSYTFGNIFSALLVDKMEKDLPHLWSDVADGRVAAALAWLHRHIHQVGARRAPMDLIREATGQGPSAESLIRHLRAKYGDLYGLTS
ncbi:carboxypeptidase M32 [bacterium]|nr:carboxypeptidase M32 [bacterium]